MDIQSSNDRPALSGGCLCGAVRYVVREAPAAVALCHCTHCQKQSGSAFSVNLVVDPARLELTGELSAFVDRADSGAQVYRRFCGSCGSPIVSEIPAKPAHVFVKAGTLDDASAVRPTVQVWCGSAQPWLNLNSTCVHFELQRGG
ncbi:GFA family protein [Achromobacter anxifer]